MACFFWRSPNPFQLQGKTTSLNQSYQLHCIAIGGVLHYLLTGQRSNLSKRSKTDLFLYKDNLLSQQLIHNGIVR